jgi:hypothetical protein
MNPELLKLIEALDAVRQFPTTESPEALRLKVEYDALIDDLVYRQPRLNRQLAEAMIERAYLRWLKAQTKPSAMPPRA